MSTIDELLLDPEVAALARRVHAERPRPAAAWAAALDERVRSGFPVAGRGWRPRLSISRRTLLPAVGLAASAAVAVAVVLPGAGGRRNSGNDGGAAVTQMAAPRAVGAAGAPARQADAVSNTVAP